MPALLVVSTLAVFLALTAGLAADLVAKSRDADASRMQARKLDVSSNHSDSLAPPDDRIDWHYFKLDQAHEISLRAKFGAPKVSASVNLSSATGRTLATATNRGSEARLVERLEPGVYYVSVEAESQTGYSLSLR